MPPVVCASICKSKIKADAESPVSLETKDSFAMVERTMEGQEKEQCREKGQKTKKKKKEKVLQL